MSCADKQNNEIIRGKQGLVCVQHSLNKLLPSIDNRNVKGT